LLELLSVLAILAVLAALLIPSLNSAQQSASRAKTKVRFAQWTAAIEAYRSEYGHYPVWGDSGLVNADVTTENHPFHDVLAARRCDGADLAAESFAAAQNPKRIVFHTFAPAELEATGLVCDASGNTAIAVLVDRNLDGVIRQGSDFLSLPEVGGHAPGANDFPATGVRAGVVFYAPSPRANSTVPEFILSWR
jgi:type II secretory pathway pseudopilin PulG